MANRVRKATSICSGLSVVIVASRQSKGKTKTQFGRASGISGLLYLVALLGVLLPCPGYGEQPRSDLAAMQGEWEVSDLTCGGTRVIDSSNKQNNPANAFTCTFVNDHLTYAIVVNNKPVAIKFSVRLDPNANPSTLDAKLLTGRDKGKTCRGIYRFENKDTLCVCLPDNPAIDRPQEFVCPHNSYLHLLRLKRVTNRPRQ